MKEWSDVATSHDPWDVVVLGAGPAGSIAARQLAIYGYQVLLIEKSPIPRFKVCGGCLSGAALGVLEEIGLGELPKKCGGVNVKKMRLASSGSTAEFDIGRRVTVSRQVFDAALVEEAAKSGATICPETVGSLPSCTESELRRIILRRRDAAITVHAKVVLVATGLSCCPPDFHTRVSPNSWIGLGALIGPLQKVDLPDVLHIAWGAAGYVGIATIEDGRLDIAAAVNPQALASAASPGHLVSEILKDSGLSTSAELGDAIWRGTPLLTRRSRPLALRRCLLIGDAAGYVEPFTGEGIGWAMRSAVLASSFLKGGLDKWSEESLDQWSMLHDRTFGRRHRQCRRIVTFLRSKTVRRVALWGLQRAPGLARPVVRELEHLN